MPELEEVEVRGTAMVEVSVFQGRRLETDIAGAARLEGRDGRYDELELSVAGASDIDLRGIAVTDADIDLAGASNVTLTMDGGALSGSMAGAGTIEYYGAVATESVRVAGAARVEQARCATVTRFTRCGTSCSTPIKSTIRGRVGGVRTPDFMDRSCSTDEGMPS